MHSAIKSTSTTTIITSAKHALCEAFEKRSNLITCISWNDLLDRYANGVSDTETIIADGWRLGSHTSPVEESREDLTVAEAAAIAAEDPCLVWVKRIGEVQSDATSPHDPFTVQWTMLDELILDFAKRGLTNADCRWQFEVHYTVHGFQRHEVIERIDALLPV